MTQLRLLLLSAVAFVVALAIGGAFINIAERRRSDEHRHVLREIGAIQAHLLERQLDRSLSSTFALASILRQSGRIDNFDTLAAEIIKSYGGISNLQLAPNGVVTQIYPLAGNEAAIGHDLLNDPRRRIEALAAIESRRLTLAGPFTLIQGGMAVIGRLPVFVPGKAGGERFWGFTIALIRLPALLELSNLNRLVEHDYNYQLSRVDPGSGQKTVFAGSIDTDLQDPISLEIEVPNGRWTLAVAPRGGWPYSSSLPLEVVLLVLVSITVGGFTYYLLRQPTILRREVEARTRQLTEAIGFLEVESVQRNRAEKALQEAHGQLEIRVQERTKELAQANVELKTENTARKRAEQALLESERQLSEQLAELELLYRTAPLGLCHMDSDLRYLRCNEKLAEINGISSADHIGRTLREIVPEIATAMESIYYQVIESGDPAIDVEATGATDADPQKVRHFSANYYPVKSEDGVVYGVSSIVQDITERKRAEKALKDAHNQLEGRVQERTKELAQANATLRAEVTERKRAEEALRESEAALRRKQKDIQDLAGKLLTAQEEERRWLARELHDDLTQRLAVLAIDAGKLEQQLESLGVPGFERLREMKEQVVKLAADVHVISRQLHPSILDDLGLVDAMEAECTSFSQREGIIVTYEAKNVPATLPKDLALSLYRITQEALRNIAKHAQTQEAHVSLVGKDDDVILMIKDPGVGFDRAQVRRKKGVGLASMEERVRLIQGDLSLQSRPGQGTVIEVRVPLTGGEV